jgi:hypothetical protein
MTGFAKYFTEDKKVLDTFDKGYVSTQDVHPHNYPEGAVSGCSNTDFYPKLRRRLPYNTYYDTVAWMPSGYAVLNYFEKRFVDKSGNDKDVKIFVVRNSTTGDVKIFAVGYYNPAVTYENNYKTSGFGWNTDVVEITESYEDAVAFTGKTITIEDATKANPCVITSIAHTLSNTDKVEIKDVLGMTELNGNVYTVANKTTDTFELSGIDSTGYGAYAGGGTGDKIWVVGGVNYNVTSVEAEFEQAEDYFRGFFVFDSEGEPIGFVTSSIWDTATAYFRVEHSILTYLTSGVLISRFKVNYFNSAFWNDITRVRFFEEPNRLKIMFGDGSWVMRLEYISDRKYFAEYSVETFVFPNYNTNSPGFTISGRFSGTQEMDYTVRMARIFGPTVVGSDKTITNITWSGTASIVTTSVAHGYSPGEWVLITGVVGMTEVNGKYFRIAATPAGDTFELEDINVSTFTGYGSAGTSKKIVATNMKWGWQYKDSIENVWKFFVYNALPDLSASYPLNNGLSIVINSVGFLVNDESTFQVNKGVNEKSWDGIYFDYDAPYIPNKKAHKHFDDSSGADGDASALSFNEIGNQLGIRYKITKNYEPITSTMLWRQRQYSLAVQIDGYQTIFIKNLFCERITGTPNKVIALDIQAFLEPWFNRRITALMLFYGEYDNDLDYPVESQLPEVYLLTSAANGTIKLSETGATKDESAYRVDILSGFYNPNPFASGVTLNDYLNQYYQKDIRIKCEDMIQVGYDVLAIRLSNDSVNTDVEDENQLPKDGKGTVALSQVQNGIINATSIFCTERFREITTGQELLRGVSLLGSQYLLFTYRKAIHGEILDPVTYEFKTHSEFTNKGLIAREGLVAAILPGVVESGPPTAPQTTQFSGVYWLGYETIWGFFGNEPVDLLEPVKGDKRWKKEYEKLSTSVRGNCVSGYLPNMQDVFFYLNSKIYIYSFPAKHWKIYNYGDAPLGFISELQGELYFWTASVVYKTEPKTTSLGRDKNSVDITFGWDWYMTHGSPAMLKIPHLLDLFYSILTTQTLGEYNAAKINIKISEKATSDVLNKDFTLRDAATNLTSDKKRQLIGHTDVTKAGMRKPWNYYKVAIASDSTTDENIITFEVNRIELTAKLRPGTVSKN